MCEWKEIVWPWDPSCNVVLSRSLKKNKTTTFALLCHHFLFRVRGFRIHTHSRQNKKKKSPATYRIYSPPRFMVSPFISLMLLPFNIITLLTTWWWFFCYLAQLYFLAVGSLVLIFSSDKEERNCCPRLNFHPPVQKHREYIVVDGQQVYNFAAHRGCKNKDVEGNRSKTGRFLTRLFASQSSYFRVLR